MTRTATRRLETPEPTAPAIHSTRTKIVATVGPASSSSENLGKLIEAGVSVFRLNFSHGTLDEHAGAVRRIRAEATRLGRPVAVLGDLQGPRIRVGKVAGDGVEVEKGARVRFQREPIVADGRGKPIVFSSTYSALVDDVEPGQRLLVNDGVVRMLIVDRASDAIECRVTHGGVISSGKGINLPESDLSCETMTDRDWTCVDWALDNEIDFLALSFVRGADDVEELALGIRTRCETRGRPGWRLPIIAKIEVPAAVSRIEAIVQAADGIMVARGDLGVEMDLALVPVIQKQLIATSQAYGKPCIIATQMFESMIERPAPSRAEASDVAGAIFDQVDAVMLSGETSIGRFPVIAVEYMRRIAGHTEGYLAQGPAQPSAPAKLVESGYRTAALAHGVWTVAQDVGAKYIVVWSQSGGGARYLSQNNFHVPIVAVTSDERAARQMQLLRGVTPVRMDVPAGGLAGFTRMMDDWLQAGGGATKGDPCILVAGEPLGVPRATNALAILVVGDPDTGFARHR